MQIERKDYLRAVKNLLFKIRMHDYDVVAESNDIKL